MQLYAILKKTMESHGRTAIGIADARHHDLHDLLIFVFLAIASINIYFSGLLIDLSYQFAWVASYF